MKSIQQQWISVMTQDEKEYFKVLGARIAQLRKDQGLTQVQLAQALDISQQMVASYEVGRRRVPVSLLPTLARALRVQIDELLGTAVKVHAKRGPASQLERSMERINELPKQKQRFVVEMLETMLAQANANA
ncbi:anaerobic benzoate catabolism transcriptional regulator [Janthinobacterium lividum]|nr:helix-turn-helix transcriptional regulator [Janthinobacterium lividum]OEZ54279.1 anaerobic benzoate catabolism transcriptional regulator [Janthinobacterium lividum]STS86049.1 anaerobic benzoate catabolism transcriptional regulator [Janthinobacterium lividum]